MAEMKHTPLLTVVSGVYGTEEFFWRCVDSILNCDFKDLELILVDDESPDNCPAMCDEAARRDNRVRVIHKKNEGCHSGPNTGIALARGKYIAFCDNDDYVPADGYSKLMAKALETDADVVQGTVRRTIVDDNDVRLWERSPKDHLKTQLIGALGAIYRTSMLQENDIKYMPFRMGDDNSFRVQVFYHANKVEYIPDVTYEYLIRSASAQNASEIQIVDFVHYYDDLRWRRFVLEYMQGKDKLLEMAKGHMAEFCMGIDEKWFLFTSQERARLFEELKAIVGLIDWKNDVQSAKGYIQIEPERFLKMSEEQYTKHLDFVLHKRRRVKNAINYVRNRLSWHAKMWKKMKPAICDDVFGYLPRCLGCSSRYKELKALKSKFEGERCFVISTGPSLTLSDVEALKNEYTFGVNGVVNLLDQMSYVPNFYAIDDGLVYERIRDKIKNATFEYAFIGNWKMKKEFYEDKHWIRFPLYVLNYFFHYPECNYRCKKFSNNAYKRVYDGFTITYSVLQLAVYMGFKEIYLIGSDCNYEQGVKSLTDYRSEKEIAKGSGQGEKMIQAFEVAAEWAKRNHVKICNVTRGGMLEAFPRENLEDVLKNGRKG